MFSSSRREPAKKPVTLTRVAGTPTTTATSSPTPTSSSTTAARPTPGAAAPRPRPPVVKVATVTRTVQVKRVVPIPPPASAAPRGARPTPPPLKRKSESASSVSSAKSRKVEGSSVRKSPVKKQRSREVSSEEEEEEGESSSSEEESTAKPKKVDTTPLVERDVSAVAEGPVECVTGEQLVLRNKTAYKEYFSDPTDPESIPAQWAGADMPSVTLEYPSIGASEKLLLLAPIKGGEEYNPIEDCIESIRLMLDFFLTPVQSETMFSHTPSNTAFSAFLSEPSSRSGTPTVGNADVSLIVPLPPLMRSLEKAKAKRDGPGFIAAVERFNAGLRTLKEDGKIKENIKAMKGVDSKIWTKITSQVYERAVGPEIEELKNYEAFSDNVYGELLPRFMGEIFQLTGLGPDSVFVDLGSGVGNCVVQAALATGCEAWGFENMAHASSLARLQTKEAEARYQMWGLNGGKMQTVEADFCACPQVNQVLRRADVVLVNNEVFSSKLNQALSLLFLDLPSGARIVSLKAFASSFTLSAYNQHSPLAILNQGAERRYARKSVSWKDEGGTFFIAKVDRTKLEKFLKKNAAKAWIT